MKSSEISIKTPAEIEIMRFGGKILADVLTETSELAKPGISTKELDDFAEKFIRDRGAEPAFKGYRGFPAALCTAINEVVVHGIPKKDEILKEGDLLTLDCGVLYKGFYTDAARTIPIGQVDNQKQRLIKTADMALEKAISMIREGIHVGALGRAIQDIIERAGFKVIYDLTGHGLGRTLHEEPTILNYYDGKPGPMLKAGMTIAIEPIFSVSSSKIKTLSDHWTIVTTDGSCAIQVENTVLVTQNGCEVLT